MLYIIHSMYLNRNEPRAFKIFTRINSSSLSMKMNKLLKKIVNFNGNIISVYDITKMLF